MDRGPLRRLLGTAGLLAVAPTALLLLRGAVTPVDAAVRALATFSAVIVVGRLVGWWLASTASALERGAAQEDPED